MNINMNKVVSEQLLSPFFILNRFHFLFKLLCNPLEMNTN